MEKQLNSLVFIPALMGLISGTYAISTFIDNQWFSVFFGIICFFIMLSVNRLFVATLDKSKNSTNTKFYTSLVFILFITVSIGVVVSHPLVLLMFREAITTNTTMVYKDTKQIEIDVLRYNIKSAIADDVKLIDERITKRDCVILLFQAEKYPTKMQPYEIWNATHTMMCGTASGKGCDMSANGGCASIKKDIAKIDDQIKDIKQRISNNSVITKLYLDLAQAEKDIDVLPPSDYLEKMDALNRLKDGYTLDGIKYEGYNHIWRAYYLLMAAFTLFSSAFILFKMSDIVYKI